MEKIYIATIYQFESKEQNDITIRYIIDEKTIHNIIGIFYNNYIIDIKTGVRYPILKREKSYLKKNENIELRQFYVGRIEVYQPTNISSKVIENYLKAFQIRRLLNKNKNTEKVKIKK